MNGTLTLGEGFIKLFKEGLFKALLQAGRQGTGKSHECGISRQVQAKALSSPRGLKGYEQRIQTRSWNTRLTGGALTYRYSCDL